MGMDLFYPAKDARGWFIRILVLSNVIYSLFHERIITFHTSRMMRLVPREPRDYANTG